MAFGEMVQLWLAKQLAEGLTALVAMAVIAAGFGLLLLIDKRR